MRLKGSGSGLIGAGGACFNSNLVRLKEVAEAGVFNRAGCFNSNLVRLKARPRPLVPISPQGFQFQSGAIKGIIGINTFSGEWQFQFQSGAIKGRFKNMYKTHDFKELFGR